MLLERGLGTEATEHVVHCIEAHRFRDTTIRPQTLEAQCVYDADKLDSMGAIGIGRVFAYAGAHGSRLWTTPVDEMPGTWRAAARTRTIRRCMNTHTSCGCCWTTLHTESARRIGRERHEVMVAFFAQLDAEMRRRCVGGRGARDGETMTSLRMGDADVDGPGAAGGVLLLRWRRAARRVDSRVVEAERAGRLLPALRALW